MADAIVHTGRTQNPCLEKHICANMSRGAIWARPAESWLAFSFEVAQGVVTHAPNHDVDYIMQMDPLLQAAPEKCHALAQKLEAGREQYEGFCMAGEAEGRGQWQGEAGDRYIGDFRKGQRHGHL
jgi:hypothetical protein